MTKESLERIAKGRHDLIEVSTYLEALRELLLKEGVSEDAKTLCEGSLARVEKIIELLVVE